jgi:hypothetical protein
LPAPVLHRPYVHPPVSLPVPNHHQTRNRNQIQSRNQSSAEKEKKGRNFCDCSGKRGLWNRT